MRVLLPILKSPEYAPLFEFVLLAATTSIHYAEAMALRWKRTNLNPVPTIADGANLPAQSVSVRENFYRGSFGTTKTKARNRIEPLPGTVVEVLTNLKAGSLFTGPDDLVFCDQATGEPLDEDVLRRKLKKAGSQAGIPWKMGTHCFRRYYATESDRKGMSAEDRQASLGHASAEMTAHYTTADIERRRPVANQIAEDLAGAKAVGNVA
jgi:integrase